MSSSRTRSASVCAPAGRPYATNASTHEKTRMKQATVFMGLVSIKKENDLALATRAAVIARLLLEHHELDALIRRQDAAHPQQHHRPGLVQFRAGRFDDADLRHHLRIVACLDHLIEVRLRPVERVLFLTQDGDGLLEDGFYLRTLVGGQPELAREHL